MVKKAELVEVVDEVADAAEHAPRFRDAILGIRSVDDIKKILTTEEYEPHVHMLFLVCATFIVGTIVFAVGA